MNAITDITSGQKYLYYNYLNIEEEIVNENDNSCYLFFSSNGLYQSDSFEEFQNTMLNRNRYEWKSIASSLKKRKGIGKIIYVRDIYKKFYIYGSSSHYTSIEETINYLRNKTKGFELTTIGISSGGFMAVIAGCLLKAEKVFCISGQFDLRGHLSEEELWEFEKINKGYLNIVDLIKKNNNIPIYYFCPVNCEHDYNNYQLVKNIKNVRCFLFPEKIHAATVYPFNFPDLIYLPKERLDYLAKYFEGHLINKKFFLVKTISFQGLVEILRRIFVSRFSISKLKQLWDVKG